MRKLLLTLTLALVGLLPSAHAQQQVPIVAGVVTVNTSQANYFKVYVTSAITSVVLTPSPNLPRQITVLFSQDATGHAVTFSQCSVSASANAVTACPLLYDATVNTWVAASSSSGPPTGAAGGCGTYPNLSCAGPVFNAVNYGLNTSNTDVQNNTALTSLFTASNAYSQTTIGGSSFTPPTVYIPYGYYSYSGGINPTLPTTIQCEPGTVLNYTGSAHAADIGPSGLTSSTLQQGEYTIEGCKFTGGASMTEGIFINAWITHVRIWKNTFTNFGNNGATVWAVWFDGFNYIADVADNDWFFNNNVKLQGVKVRAQDGNTQLSYRGNQYSSVNGAQATTCGTAGGTAVYVDGTGSRVINNNIGCGLAPSVILGSNCSDCQVLDNYFENMPSGSITPIIQWTGSLDGVQIAHAYYNAHSQAAAYLLGPVGGTDTLKDTVIRDIHLANFTGTSAILLNNVAGQTGNSYEDIYSGTSAIGTFRNAAGNIVPWTCYDTCGTGDYGVYLDQNSGLALYGAGENLVIGGTGPIVGNGSGYRFASSGVTSPDTGLYHVGAHFLCIGNNTLDDCSGTLAGASFESGGTKFTATGCSNTTLVGGASAGSYTSGTTGTCTVTITVGSGTTAANNGWSCWANDVTTPADVQHQTGGSTTTAIISGTTASGDVVNFGCLAY